MKSDDANETEERIEERIRKLIRENYGMALTPEQIQWLVKHSPGDIVPSLKEEETRLVYGQRLEQETKGPKPYSWGIKYATSALSAAEETRRAELLEELRNLEQRARVRYCPLCPKETRKSLFNGRRYCSECWGQKRKRDNRIAKRRSRQRKMSAVSAVKANGDGGNIKI